MVSPYTLYEADLHCHTTASDGLLTPTELVRLVAELGLKGVAITDHDTIQGWDEAEDVGSNYQIQILKGIELNTNWHGEEVHILGYELDGSSSYLKGKLGGLREAREQRMFNILDRLATLGIDISEDEVRQFAQGESIGRPHIAQVLLNRGFVRSIKEGFERYIGRGAPAYVPRYKLTPEEGIELVRKAQGVAVLAHPGIGRLEEGIPAWIEAGLQGIEVQHSEHKPEDVLRYSTLAEQYNLLATGGSDFHGEARKPGVEVGRWGVSLNVVEQIFSLAKQNRLSMIRES
ncbi:metal-dependent phosphoesterase [Desulfosporosinus sp. I2]|uniref:PHP domain-containing protein n=1 Tax=Desulfosporosinus sp. I2 TaxID=1617025 RepID=UPI0005F08D83|nr:PHP domain-containing protein [Desulfosporosinus sp. I2]KJR45077.1 metal-dependent phosphoesterase [Desulfosporosinus sp. I2]